MATKLRAEVKPASEYLAAPSELPGALRNAVSSAERKWKRAVAAEPKQVEEREKAVAAVEEALRGAARANPSRGGNPRIAGSHDGEEVSPELLPAPPRSGGSASPAPRLSPPPSPHAAVAPASPQRSPGPVRVGSPANVLPKKAAEATPLPSLSPRKASPRREVSPKAEPSELKESKPSTYDSDLDGASESEREVNILPTVLQQMTAPAPVPAAVPAAEKSGTSPARPARLEKTRGSVALPRGEALENWSEERAEPKPEDKKKEAGKGEEAPGKAPGGGLKRGLLSLLKLDGESAPEEEEKEPEMVISGPVNVSHQAHIGPDNLAEADALFKKQEELSTSKKRLSSPIRILSLRGKSKATVDEPEDGNDEEEEEEGGLVITGPTEVTHQGHVDTGIK